MHRACAVPAAQLPQAMQHVAAAKFMMCCNCALQLTCTWDPSLQGMGMLEAGCKFQGGLPLSSPAPVTPVCRGWGFWRRAVAARTVCHSPVAGRGALLPLECCRVTPSWPPAEVLQPGHSQRAGFSRRGEPSICFSLHSAAVRRGSPPQASVPLTSALPQAAGLLWD